MSRPSSTCTDDRIILGRRGAIGATEWQDLMDHLTSCSDCRVVWLAVQSFEGTGGTQPEDERVVRRAVHAALATRSPSRSAPWRFTLRPAVMVGMVAMLVAAVASAGIVIHRRLTAPPEAASPVDQPASGVGEARRGSARRAAPEEPRLEPAPLEVRAAEPAKRPRPDHLRMGLPEGRSGRLFAQALAARGAGRTEQALALFRRLQRDFPDTDEATVSLVSAGQLLVEAAAFRAALASFDAYLRRAPEGPLVPEALASKSRLLDQLGRGEEADRARRELRRRVPEWPYTPRPRSAGLR
jgi:TolA-binding protein